MGSKAKQKSFEPFRTIIIAGALALLFRSLLFEPFNIPSGSMIPTLKVGDYLFVSKFSYGYSRYSFPFAAIPFSGRVLGGEPERGDVVVFKQPRNESVAFIKRVVGLPGDEIAVRRGVLHINDVPVVRQHVDVGTATDGFSVMKYDDYIETFPEGSTHHPPARGYTSGGTPSGRSHLVRRAPFLDGESLLHSAKDWALRLAAHLPPP